MEAIKGSLDRLLHQIEGPSGLDSVIDELAGELSRADAGIQSEVEQERKSK